MNKPSHWAQYFGLRANPFADTIDTALFYRTRGHEQAAVKIRLGVEDRHALILLTGVSGTGKTLVSQVVLRALDLEHVVPALVLVYPGMGKGALLREIGAELRLPAARFLHQRLAALQEEALRLHARGRRLLIVIDEAHFLKADALHILRTLSNLETEREKLVTVLLVAEEGLKRRLAAPSYASLRGRITFAVHLAPLSVAELEQYLKYRILKCGGRAEMIPPPLFPLIHELSGGIPREANRLLYAACIEAMTLAAPLDAAILRAAAGVAGERT